ncbi:MAG: hypothetical protein KatS3mg057_2460 [Herpetosiphonaceae bacterium]|nr:MAG: hypothetical protein KatS3mg057_2460 [Herpetosiphonaceae bacterium]
MINVERQQTLQVAIDTLHRLLSNPINLPQLLPRIKRVEIGKRDGSEIPVVAHISVGLPGAQRYPGIFRVMSSEIVFEAQRPLLVLARWQLRPEGTATHVSAQLRIDFGAMLKPFSRLGGRHALTALERDIASEMEESLRRAERLAQG